MRRRSDGPRVHPDQTEMFPETKVALDEPEPKPRAHARRTDPSTSVRAAESVDVPRHRVAVLGAFAVWGRMSDETLVKSLERRRPQYGISPQSARSRRAELAADGLLEVVGEETTERGHACRVFDLTERGHAEARRVGWVAS